MTQYLIIPSAGIGKRFKDKGYETYKPFLKVSKKDRIIDNILNNFSINDTHLILIGNKKNFHNINLNFKSIKKTFIEVENHKYGPIYSIYLAKQKIKDIIGNSNFFVSYSDINWIWDYHVIKKFIKNKKIVIFSHKGFHPHLELDSKSDFFLSNSKNFVSKVSEKKTILNDYKVNDLAIGCYYFENFEFFENFFYSKYFKKNYLKKENYIINLIDFLINSRKKINYFEISNFVHLGTPYQYENFIYWKKIFAENKKLDNKNFPSIMLMAGKGKRIKKLGIKKPFLKIKGKNIFEFILDKFNSKKKYIITNQYYFNNIKRKFNILKIKKTNSMIATIDKSFHLFIKKKNFFILSCDCYGNFEFKSFRTFIKNKDPDVVIFPFKISEFQKTLSNSHSSIEIHKNKIKAINVKKFVNKPNEFGHAGFFWIKNANIFKNLDIFKSKHNLTRELLLDDYFKYLFDNNVCKVDYFMLDQYVHIGSIKEYQELKYWENYFTNVN